MDDIEKLYRCTKKLNVLYVEDNLDVQDMVKEIFKEAFKNIFTASDGKEGLEVFNSNSIDMVISDIEMPNMDGLEMVEQIRKLSDVPVILLTAFDNREFLLKAIHLKVDEYIFKPLDVKQTLQTFLAVAKMIEDKRLFEELKVEKEHQESILHDESVIFKTADAVTCPIVIYENNKPIYLSSSFKKLDNDGDFLFSSKKGYIDNLQKYDNEKPLNNRVYIKQKIGAKIFKVVKQDIELDAKRHIYMYILVDVTFEEYQKVKIKSYVKSLECLTIKQKKAFVSQEKDEKSNLKINNSLEESLRKRKSDVMTAEELVDSLDVSILEELQELDDLDSDLRDAMDLFRDNDFSTLHLAAQLLSKYANEIYSVVVFEDLYTAIKSLSDLLYSIDVSSIDENRYSDLSLYLNSIREDLSSWRKNIFVYQNTDNIHYLDSSLFATALHIELLLNDKEDINYDESVDDLEFF